MNEEVSDAELIQLGICPDCGSKMAMEGGCCTCYACGFSACS